SASADAPEAPEILREAAAVPRQDPAFATVAFHRARLLAGRSQSDEARRLLDSWLTGPADEWPRSSRNLFLAERFRLSRSFEELMRFAARVPVTFQSELGAPAPAEYVPGTGLLDEDAAWILDRHLPLDLLARAARDSSLSLYARRRLALASWVR